MLYALAPWQCFTTSFSVICVLQKQAKISYINMKWQCEPLISLSFLDVYDVTTNTF
jgi:hypothetical protein